MTTTNETKTPKPTVLQRLSLYEIALEGKLIEDILIEGDGELTPETEARMDALLKSGAPKIEGACLIIKELEASEEAAAKEAKRMQARKQSFERNAEGLKARVALALDAAFSGKVKTERVTAYTQKSPDRLTAEFLAEPDQLAHLHAAHPDLVIEEKVYRMNAEAILAIWEEERPAREAYEQAVYEWDEYYAQLEPNEESTRDEPKAPPSRLPAVVTVVHHEGRRFLQIR